MFIVDVSWHTIVAARPTDPTRFFYTEDDKFWTVYAVLGNFLMRHKVTKKLTEDDILFIGNYLANATKVDGIEGINEGPWRKMIMNIDSRLARIEELLESRKK